MVDLKIDELVLEKITLEDAYDYYLIASNRNITTSFMLEYTNTINEAKSTIIDILNSYNDSEYYFWAIRLNKKLIGIVKTYESDYLELGYAINEDYWNKGYATKALKVVTDYFLKIPRIKTIILGAFIDNEASIRVMQKCGYKYFCTKFNEFFYLGKTRSIIYYKIDKN